MLNNTDSVFLDDDVLEEDDICPPEEVKDDAAYRIQLPALQWTDPDPTWRQHAMCAVYPSLDWFNGRHTKHTKNICLTECTVREECLNFALRNELEWGVFGGLTADERKEALGAFSRRQYNEKKRTLTCG
jgi:WhiB family redox-sensing transcriptional regulator